VSRGESSAAPRHAEIAYRGFVALQEGRNAEAAEHFRRAVELSPDTADYHLNLGAAYQRSTEHDKAAAAFTQAVRLEPQSPEAHFNLGAALEQLRSPYAVSAFERAGALGKDHFGIQRAVGAALLRVNELTRALPFWQRAVSLDPRSVEALVELGTNQRLLGEHRAAIESLRGALSLDPRRAAALVELAGALMEVDALDDAEAAARQALALEPSSIAALFNLSSALMLLGRAAESADTLRRLLALDETQADAHSNLLVVLNYHPDATAEELLEEARTWGRAHAPALPEARPVRAFSASERLRIGYFSADYATLAPFTAPLCEHHDAATVEVTFYSGTALPAKLLDAAARHRHRVRDVGSFDDDALVRLIREDGIDVLVDLTMHLAGSRLRAFAHEPAPVQIAWLAYPGTTGVPAFDVRLTDPSLDPRDTPALPYTEESVWLPDVFWPYAPAVKDVEPGRLPALANGFITFGSLNAFAKVHDGVLDAWGQVLGAVRGSKLVMLAPSGHARERVLRRVALHGVHAGRVEFVGRRPQREYLETYRRIDLCLDTFPANGHTTSLDAFWMGVPVISFAGNRAVARAGLCIARQLQLPDLVAEAPSAFVDTAVRWATDLERLAAVRASLREKMLVSAFMDGPRFVANLETAYREAVRIIATKRIP
jgi:predicted O-linked N-acetylglucosamine transferase (SPINDLY family)